MWSNKSNVISKDLDNLGLADEVILKRVVRYVQLRNCVFMLLGGVVGVVLFILLLSLSIPRI